VGKVKSTDSAVGGSGGILRKLTLSAALHSVCLGLLVIFCVTFVLGQGPLTIQDAALPPLVAGEQFTARLHATGGAPPYHWFTDGPLPDGINLSIDGVLSGRPAKSGAFTVTIILADSGHPSQKVQKSFQAEIATALGLEWLDAPKVNNDRIDGSVAVTNGSRDTYDLTVIVEAVAENGRATALGYQHFPLKPGTKNFPITFGQTLPSGAYVIHADAVAEIPARKNILRQRLQTPGALHIVATP